MSGKHIGYVRVSSSVQHTDRQLAQGVQLDRVFSDHCSGKNTERPGLIECLSYIRSEDTLHVHSIDRLARTVMDLESLVSELTAKGVTVHFHKENLIFSANKEDAMSRLLFHLLSSVAQFERSLILDRQREGVASALLRGVKFGRPEKLDGTKKQEIRDKAKEGVSKESIAQDYGISRQTVYAVLKQAV